MKLQELLETNRISIAPSGHHHSRDGWLQFDCPYCGSGSQKWHMGYNMATGTLNCWRCGRHRLAETIARLLEINLSDAIKITKQLTKGVRFEPRVKRTGVYCPPKGRTHLEQKHKTYLKKRGYDPDEITTLWSIQGIGVSARLSWRIFIPIMSDDEAVSWTTRSVMDRPSLRYISARPEEESVSHKEILYGEDYCRHAIIVHEGPFDVWRTGPGATATLGTATTPAQVAAIAKYPIRVLCFDNEPTAQRRASSLCDKLEGFPGETYNVVLDAKDASEASPKQIKRLRKFLE